MVRAALIGVCNSWTNTSDSSDCETSYHPDLRHLCCCSEDTAHDGRPVLFILPFFDISLIYTKRLLSYPALHIRHTHIFYLLHDRHPPLLCHHDLDCGRYVCKGLWMGIYVAVTCWRSGSLEDCETERGYGIQKGEEGSQGMIERMVCKIHKPRPSYLFHGSGSY